MVNSLSTRTVRGVATTTTVPPLLAALGVALALASAPGCSSNDVGSGGGGGSGGCRLDSECPLGNTCIAGECLAICAEDRDCPVGEICWPDYGCLPDGEQPPIQGPPRGVVIDPATPGVITFTGCELDIDCDPGLECRGGECLAVDPNAACVWSDTEPMVVRHVVDLLRVESIDQEVGSAICLHTTHPDGTDDVTTVWKQSGSLTASVFVSANPVQTCVDVAPYDAGLLVISASPSSSTFNAVSAHTIDSSGVLHATTTLVPESRCTAGGNLILSGPNRPSYLVCADRSRNSSVFSGRIGTGTPWTMVHETPEYPSIAVGASEVAVTSQDSAGIVWISGGPATPEIVATGHRGIAVHHRAGDEFGWFSTDSQGGVFYSIGSRGGVWQTEATGHTEATMTVPRSLRAHVAASTSTGNPNLVFDVSNDSLIRTLVRSDGTWHSWIHDTTARLESLRATWTGCGRPAWEFISTASVDLPGGWYAAEAH